MILASDLDRPRQREIRAQEQQTATATIHRVAVLASLAALAPPQHRLAWRGVGVGRHAPAVFSRCMPPVAAAPEAGAPASADEPVNVGDSQTTIANSGAAPAAAPSDAAAAPASDDDTLVQFVVVRRDLLKTMEWPVGSVIAQACHACLAVAWENKDDPDVASYLAAENINSMHKVTKVRPRVPPPPIATTARNHAHTDGWPSISVCCCTSEHRRSRAKHSS